MRGSVYHWLNSSILKLQKGTGAVAKARHAGLCKAIQRMDKGIDRIALLRRRSQ
jgi:hypothetical protein